MYQFSNVLQVGKEVSMFHKLSNETQWLLNGDTAHQADHMWVVSLGYLLHCINLVEEVRSLTACCTCCYVGGWCVHMWEGVGGCEVFVERKRRITETHTLSTPPCMWLTTGSVQLPTGVVDVNKVVGCKNV